MFKARNNGIKTVSEICDIATTQLREVVVYQEGVSEKQKNIAMIAMEREQAANKEAKLATNAIANFEELFGI